jgi:hypothetical protein
MAQYLHPGGHRLDVIVATNSIGNYVKTVADENPRWRPVLTGASLGVSGRTRARDFISIRLFLHGPSHLGDGASNLSAGRPRART